jgi:hypothetical protein
LAIPQFDSTGQLPAGIHQCTWSEFTERFDSNPARRRLLLGLRTALWILAGAGCRTVYLDGSFVTAKQDPRDWDGCWDPDGVDFDSLNEALLDASPGGIYLQRTLFLGELYIAHDSAVSGMSFLEFFQLSKEDGRRKGILRLDPREVER